MSLMFHFNETFFLQLSMRLKASEETKTALQNKCKELGSDIRKYKDEVGIFTKSERCEVVRLTGYIRMSYNCFVLYFEREDGIGHPLFWLVSSIHFPVCIVKYFF